MTDYTDQNVDNLIVNKLTFAKYTDLKNAGQLSDTEVYQITDPENIGGTTSWGAIQGTLSNQADLQSALNAKQNVITGAASTIINDNLISGRVVITDENGKITNSTSINTIELNCLNNITSNIQEQLDSKQSTDNLSQTLDTSTTKYPSNAAVKAAIDAKDSLPDQTGNADKFLKTDGTTANWAEIGGGLEIGDIGFAPLGIDETQNKRRYLNGQVISQTQFATFTDKVKAAIALYPNLVTTETNWQAEVTNSPYGICGKFVIDDTAGTIRLPKYPDWNIREVWQAPVVGNGMTLGLTDGTHLGSLYNQRSTNVASTGYENLTLPASVNNVSTFNVDGILGITTDPTKSGMIADLVNANTEDKLQGKWFIQVATGSEESVDVTREIELNNPFFFGMSQYFESEPNNASWLISNGTYHSGATYTSFYEWLLKIHNGTLTVDGVSVKAYGASDITDYDFVINTADGTFRLPLLDGSEDLSGNGNETLNLPNSGNTITATKNGKINLIGVNSTAYRILILTNKANGEYENFTAPEQNGAYGGVSVKVKKGDVVKVEYRGYGSYGFFLIPAVGNGSLYFYVGETIQDANVINAAGVLTRVADLSDSYISGLGMPSTRYINLTLGASGATYTAPANGWFACRSRLSTTGWLQLNNNSASGLRLAEGVYSTSIWAWAISYVPCKKGDIVGLAYSGTIAESNFRFIYAAGEGDK